MYEAKRFVRITYKDGDDNWVSYGHAPLDDCQMDVARELHKFNQSLHPESLVQELSVVRINCGDALIDEVLETLDHTILRIDIESNGSGRGHKLSGGSPPENG